jgi:hypothetical protein
MQRLLSSCHTYKVDVTYNVYIYAWKIADRQKSMYYCLHSYKFHSHLDTFVRALSAYTDICTDGDYHDWSQRLLLSHVLPPELLGYAATS